ncbi:TetR/AcrR family transcriptional regulator [Sphaerisporangium sp. NPDC051017]|uniref:TetR/AcrR family transcriptional regulator n=1 Tax=Sphaerisporangium sp. NPDC051017 TaxID=3154636 RepID=UPI0034404F1A
MSSLPRRRIDEIGDESRRRILDAAEELFAERGVDRTSFVDIAERSGISRGSIPWHFNNKDGLILAVVERAMNRLARSERHGTVPSLGEVLADYLTWARDTPSGLMFMILTEAMTSTGVVHAQYQEFLESRRAAVQAWLRAQRPEGVAADWAGERERAFAAGINGAVMGIHLQALIDPDGVDLQAGLALIAQLIDDNLDDVWVEGADPRP